MMAREIPSDVKARLMVLPQCPHLHRESEVCKHATKCLGTVFPVDGVFCNVTCREYGPNLGRTLTETKLEQWTQSLFDSYYSRWSIKPLLAKAWERHRRPMTVVPPKNLDRLREAFKSLQCRPEILTVCATGSVTTKEAAWPCKDIDIVIVVADLDAYLDNKQEIESLIPRQIDGIAVDRFVRLCPSSFFISVDLWDLTMYCSVKDTTAVAGEGISRVVNPVNFGQYDEMMERTMTRFLEHGSPFDERSIKEIRAMLSEDEPKPGRGLGDRVSRLIKVVTLGKAKECSACKKRREALNRLGRKVGL